MKRLILLLCGIMSLVTPIHSEHFYAFQYTYKGQTLKYEIASEEEKTCYVCGVVSIPEKGPLYLPEKALHTDGTPYTLVEIGREAFWLKPITSAVIPNTVHTIGENAFCYSDINSIVIGKSVKNINRHAFSYCSKLTSVVIPNSVQKIGDFAFVNCSAMTSVTISNSVKEILAGTFKGCAKLTSVIIPNSVQSIGDEAFNYCEALPAVVIPNSVSSIGKDAFSNCTGLKKSAYPDKIPNPFSYGVAIAYPTQTAKIENGFIFDQTTIYYAPLTLSGEYTVSSAINSIADNAFSYCKDLTYVSMPETLTNIGKKAFTGCSIYDFTIPKAIKKFDMSALSDNPLKSFTVGSGVTEFSGWTSFNNANIEKILWLGNKPPIGYKRFNPVINIVANDKYNFSNQIIYPFLSSYFEVDGTVYVPINPSERTCSVIDYHYIPSNSKFSVPAAITNKGIQMKVCDIGAYAFYHHDYLTDISLDNNGVIDDYAFYDCTKLRSVTFGNNILEIKNHTFQNCEVLKEVVNSPALTSIGKWAFSGCVGMEYFSAGDKITLFGEEAFSDCTALKKFYSYAATPPVCGDQALDDINKWDCTLYVPTNSKSLYASAPQWKDFFYVEGLKSGVETVMDDYKADTEIFDLNGIKQNAKLDNLPSGVYIIRQGTKAKKITVN